MGKLTINGHFHETSMSFIAQRLARTLRPPPPRHVSAHWEPHDEHPSAWQRLRTSKFHGWEIPQQMVQMIFVNMCIFCVYKYHYIYIYTDAWNLIKPNSMSHPPFRWSVVIVMSMFFSTVYICRIKKNGLGQFSWTSQGHLETTKPTTDCSYSRMLISVHCIKWYLQCFIPFKGYGSTDHLLTWSEVVRTWDQKSNVKRQQSMLLNSRPTAFVMFSTIVVD